MAGLSATLIVYIFSQCHTCLTSQIQDSRCNGFVPAGDKVCLALQNQALLIPWNITLEADSAFPLLTFVSPNAQYWKAPERGTSSLPLASSMADIPGYSNGSHTSVTAEPQLEGKGQG